MQRKTNGLQWSEMNCTGTIKDIVTTSRKESEEDVAPFTSGSVTACSCPRYCGDMMAAHTECEESHLEDDSFLD